MKGLIRASVVTFWVLVLMAGGEAQAIQPSIGLSGAYQMFESGRDSVAVDPEKDSTKVRRMSWIGLPIIFYTPETKLALGGAVINTFRFPKEPLDSRPSQIQFGAAYTFNNQILAYLPFRLYWNRENWVSYGEFGYYRYNFFYFGTGNYQEPAYRENFRVVFPRIRLNMMRKVAKGTYLGLRYVYDGFNITSRDTAGQLINDDVTGSNGGAVSGIGPVMNFDSRDNIFWPSKGAFVEALAYVNAPFLGSPFTFARFSLDASWFRELPWGGHRIAANFYGEIGAGDPPFYQMAMLGGSKKMRGYIEGQYRERNLWLVQTEYRAPIFWRISLVGFMGVGAVARDIGDFGSVPTRFAGGGGLRFMLDKKEKINVRIDYGLAKYGGGFYFTFSEAF